MTVQNQSELVKEIYNIDEFKSIIQDNELVVLDFYSTQCPPCVVSVYFLIFFHKFEVLTKIIQVVAPLYTHLAEKYSKAKFFKVSLYQLLQPDINTNPSR